MTTGTGLMHRVMLAVGGLPWVRIFRHNVGMAWTGDARRLPNGDVLIKNPRPLHAGLVKGGSDLVGWTSRRIEPRHVGETWAVFTGIEVKDGSGRTNTGQRKFLAAVEAAGGIAGVARSEEDAVALVGKPKDG